MNSYKNADALQRALMTNFKDEAEYIKERRERAIKRMGDRWILAAKVAHKNRDAVVACAVCVLSPVAIAADLIARGL